MNMFRSALLVACLAWSSACGGGDVETTEPESGFTLALSPPALAVTQGQTVPLGASIVRSGGFDGAVAIDAVSLPTGVSIASIDVPAGAASANLTVSLGFDAPLGRLSIPLRARSPGLDDRTTTLVLEVAPSPPPALSLTFSRTTLIGNAEDSLALVVTVQRIGRVEGPITVSAVSTLPDGLEVPPIVIPEGATSGTIRFLTGRATPSMRVWIVFEASHPSAETVSEQMQLDVRATPRLLFAFDRTPLIMRPSETRESRLFVEREVGGYDGPITMRLLTPPAGIEASLVPDHIPDRASITVSVGPTVTPSVYMIRTELRGTGRVVDTAGLQVVVESPANVLYQSCADGGSLLMVARQSAEGNAVAALTPADRAWPSAPRSHQPRVWRRCDDRGAPHGVDAPQ